MRGWRPEKLNSCLYLKQVPVLVMLFCFWIAACSPGRPVISLPTELEPTPAEAAVETVTPPSPPTPTPTIEPLPGRVILLAPQQGDALLLAEVQSVIKELVRDAGYQVEILASLSPEDITPDVRMVVGLPPDPGLEELARSASGTEFFAIGIPGLNEAPNLTSALMGPDGIDQQGFMGGVISALVTPDWRIGVISVSDTPEGIKAREAFINGAVYLCGTCRQIYPPFFDNQNQLIQYPLYVELPSTASDIEWQSATDYLIERGVETIYVFPGSGGEGLLNYLAESGINIIGGIAPAESLQENWVASVYSNSSSSWRERLEIALSGQEIPEVSGELRIDYVNANLLSPGRQRLAEEILEDLLAGYIEAGTSEDPQQE
jgi:hypothetical protein